MTNEARETNQPLGWMRRWAFDGEKPHKVKQPNGRWAWPGKYKLVEVTRGKCLEDDVPLYAVNAANEAKIAALVKAGRKVLDGLNARIQAASDEGGQSVPVFDGIADLHDALNLAEGKE